MVRGIATFRAAKKTGLFDEVIHKIYGEPLLQINGERRVY